MQQRNSKDVVLVTSRVWQGTGLVCILLGFSGAPFLYFMVARVNEKRAGLWEKDIVGSLMMEQLVQPLQK